MVAPPRRVSLVVIVGLVGSVRGLAFTKRFDSDSTHTSNLPDEDAVIGEGFRTVATVRQVKAE